jgi:hypothetical protein
LRVQRFGHARVDGIELLRELFERRRRAVVFSAFEQTADFVE